MNTKPTIADEFTDTSPIEILSQPIQLSPNDQAASAGFWVGYGLAQSQPYQTPKPPPNPYPLHTIERRAWSIGHAEGRKLGMKHYEAASAASWDAMAKASGAAIAIKQQGTST